MRLVIAMLSLLVLALPAAALAGLDAAGNYDDGGISVPPADDPGDPCGTCPDPASSMRGVTYRNGDLYVLSQSGTIYQLQNCTAVASVSIQTSGFFFGLGWDSTRDLFVVSDAGADVIHTVNPANGAVMNTFPSPASGPVGAAYDATRDLYWISDFNAGAITSLMPNGAVGPSIPVPAGSRIAGTAYDAATDVLYYNGRDQAAGYCISASTGALISSFAIAPGGNNGQGAGIDPSIGNVWITHFENPTIYCYEKDGGSTPVDSSTWGSIKAIYE